MPAQRVTEPPLVLAVNAGSSTLKFGLYPLSAGPQGWQALAPLISGCFEGLRDGERLRLLCSHRPAQLLPSPAKGQAMPTALAELQALLKSLLGDLGGSHRLLAMAHRVVHGGDRYRSAVRVDAQVLEHLRAYEALAPLHQAHNLEGLQAFSRQWPELPQIACFDTAFHADLPALETRFALPRIEALAGVRRYGFHGLSYDYLSQCLARLSPRSRQPGSRALLAHLGNGASLCATRDGRSLASSMGFSALDGLMMGSRCGSLDAGVLLHLLRQGWDWQALEDLLYRRSGLQGVSGLSADLRQLRASDSEAAREAIALFGYRLRREAWALTGLLGGLDVLAFTGGIGEHDAPLRAELCESLAPLGLRLDEDANARAGEAQRARPIHAADSTAEIWVVPTDEGRVAAQQAACLLRPTGSAQPADGGWA